MAYEMKAGRELDALIAEKVMGISPRKMCEGEMGDYYDGWMCFKCGESGTWSEMDKYENHLIHLKYYSTQIANAWLVVEKCKDRLPSHSEGFCIDYPTLETYGTWIAGWWCLGGNGLRREFIPELSATADTAPLAICLAALRAVGNG